MALDVWIPGTPQQAARHRHTKTGRAFKPKENVLREVYVRERIEKALEESPLKPYMPFLKGEGWVEADVYAFFPKPDSLFPGAPMDRTPDFDNVLKLLFDAPMGGKKTGGRPVLLFGDDSMVARVSFLKEWWNPDWIGSPGLPQEPGTSVRFCFYPYPRDPDLLPAGVAVCPRCGRDDFKTMRAHQTHVNRCG
jgi:Holliday junction resolvase RusA-like endonuclease